MWLRFFHQGKSDARGMCQYSQCGFVFSSGFEIAGSGAALKQAPEYGRFAQQRGRGGPRARWFLDLSCEFSCL
eukprot:NODE_24332_length_629_cov_3.653386.p3 GENE.NODE_24332_length_629_cov_3.653386~~NODE_24332_length_629_cov_3.653386.p3  ORF type:complete len:73 (-),score=2.07 NODE_24332_length_629_cov_3.653386:305-523(-)